MQTNSLDITITSIPEVHSYTAANGKRFLYQPFKGMQHGIEGQTIATPFQLREKHMSQIAAFSEGNGARVYFYISPWADKTGKPAGVFLNVFKMEKIDTPMQQVKQIHCSDPDRKSSTNNPQ